MKVTLKGIKVNQVMSEETLCFSASIYLDGKRVGVVSNRGHGGPNEYQWSNAEAGRQIEAWAETVETDYDFEKLDQIVDGLLEKAEEEKQLRRWCKKETLFSVEGDDNGAFRTIKAPFNAEVKAHLVKKYGDKLVRIVNETL